MTPKEFLEKRAIDKGFEPYNYLLSQKDDLESIQEEIEEVMELYAYYFYGDVMDEVEDLRANVDKLEDEITNLNFYLAEEEQEAESLRETMSGLEALIDRIGIHVYSVKDEIKLDLLKYLFELPLEKLEEYVKDIQ